MSKKINEGIVDKVFGKVINLVMKGQSRKAMNAFKKDKKLQRDIKAAADAQDTLKKSIEKLRKDPEFEKEYQKSLKL
jgi:hypothetical protein|tara:strand:+ start:2149 stop:2379 length:231 start_codon:yes stop_codon:yes gene_type:complete